MNYFKIVLIFSQLDLFSVRAFDVYWNIPTEMCRKYGMKFDETVPTFDIIQNDKDNFHKGEKITILYDAGFFPMIKKNGEIRNGGVPQEGNLTEHLETYRQHIGVRVPDEHNKGLIVIDFELWRPIFRQNFGSLEPYKNLSYQIEKENHPDWEDWQQKEEAVKRFNKAARTFVEGTIKLSKHLRPIAKWGLYAFPFCFNVLDECPLNIQKENDLEGYMFHHSDMIFPSVYLSSKITATDKKNMVTARIREAVRASKLYSIDKKPIYVYIRYVYPDSKEFLTKEDFLMVFGMAKNLGCHGIIIWGASADLSSQILCENFHQYLENIIGPISRSFSATDPQKYDKVDMTLLICLLIGLLFLTIAGIIIRRNNCMTKTVDEMIINS